MVNKDSHLRILAQLRPWYHITWHATYTTLFTLRVSTKESVLWGWVICELRTGELVICELIVRTTDANLGYNANQKVRTFYAIKRGFCIRNVEITFITIQNAEKNRLHVHCTCYKNTTKLHVSVAAEIICTILGLRICLINELTGATRNPL